MPNLQTRIPKESKLLKIKTDFRNLKYSQDTRGGGTSGLPFIKAPIPEEATLQQKNIYQKTQSGANVGDLRRNIDTTRIGRFLATEKGKQFTRDQKTLQFQNPKTEVGQQINRVDNTGRTFLGGIINNFLRGGAIENTRVFNNNNTLYQVGKEGTGYHFNRHGNTPITPYQSTYYYRVKNKETDENRLVLLKTTKIDSRNFISSTSANVGSLNDTGISKKSNLLFEYLGGPGSNSDSSFTVIQRADYTNNWNNYKFPSFPLLSKAVPSWERPIFNFNENQFSPTTAVVTADPSKLTKLLERINSKSANSLIPGGSIYTTYTPDGEAVIIKRYEDSTFEYSNEINLDNFDTRRGTTSDINRTKTLTYKQILDKGRNLDNIILGDFRSQITDIPSTEGYRQNGVDYLNAKYGVGNPGAKDIKRVDYSTVGKKGNDQGVDRINTLDVGDTYTESNKDLIKCMITAVETQQNTDTLTSVFTPLVFRAFVTNFSDAINANYGEHQYVGRGEKFYTYNNADRKVNFQLAIAAQSRVEMAPLYRKLNYLISQMYPGYSGFVGGTGNGFMRAPLVKLTIGDYLMDQPGFLNSINITVPEESPWEVKADATGKDSDMYQLPHYLTLSIQFTPIHNFLARRAHLSQARGYVIPSFVTPNESSIQPNGEINGNNLFNIG